MGAEYISRAVLDQYLDRWQIKFSRERDRVKRLESRVNELLVSHQQILDWLDGTGLYKEDGPRRWNPE